MEKRKSVSGTDQADVEALTAILAALGVSLATFVRPFKSVQTAKTPRRRG